MTNFLFFSILSMKFFNSQPNSQSQLVVGDVVSIIDAQEEPLERPIFVIRDLKGR